MPLALNDNTPTKFPEPEFLTLDNFKRGVITIVDKSRLAKNALERADNIWLVEDGQPAIRPGIDWFGTEVTGVATTKVTSATAAAGTNWTNPTNVYASDNARATYANANQNDLIIKFSLNIPTTAVITGLTVKVEGNGADATADNRSIEIGITKDGSTLAGSRLAAQNLNQTTDTTLTFGSASELFDTTLTPAELNTADFGVMLRAGNTNTGQRSIDHVTIEVSYTPTGPIQGFDWYDYNDAIHLVAVRDGAVYRSTNNGTTWAFCSGLTLDGTAWVDFNQNSGYLYITNGINVISRYNGTTTLETYDALSKPTGVAATRTNLVGTTYTYYYKVSAVNSIGFTEASTEDLEQVSLTRANWSATNFVTVTWNAVSGANRYDVYISENNVDFFYLGSTLATELSFKDDGTFIPIPSTTAPTDNTTTGPKFEELTNVGARQYGVRDRDNPYRIWFSGANAYAGAFSLAYDGGYLDWQTGAKLRPVKVEDYRDGKNEPKATVWCESSDGSGGIIQMTLSEFNVDNITVIIPEALKLPGSRGTPSPGSVVNVLNDYMFYNSQAFYNLGSRAQFLNLLSTDEVSSNIRPTIKQIQKAGEKGIASIYYEAKVYFSVPYNGTENDATIIYDTERKAWLPKAFTVGFKKFVQYTGSDKVQRLLCVKPGDSRLSEISENFPNDYGEPFVSSLVTGLYPVTKNRFEFQWTEEAEFEFSNPQDQITIDLIGIDRKRGYSVIKSRPINISPSTSGIGWDTFGWDTMEWDDDSILPSSFSESSVKRYFNVQKELNAIQWAITTRSPNSRYVLRTLQTWGTNTLGGKPRQWKA